MHNWNGRIRPIASISFTSAVSWEVLATGLNSIVKYSSAHYRYSGRILPANRIRCTKPGGWIEDLEFSIVFKSDDGTITGDHVMARWSRLFLEAGEKMGKTFRAGERARELITNAGFTNVTEKRYKLPIGDWSSDPKMKELGQWNLLYCVQGLEGFALFLLSKIMEVSDILPRSRSSNAYVTQWEYTEIQALLGQMKAALLKRKNHAYYDV